MDTEIYRHLMLAVDFEKDSEAVIERARVLKNRLGARLTLLHVVEYLPPAMESMYLGYSGEMALPADAPELEKELVEVARRQIDVIGDRLGVDPADRQVRMGSAGPVIDQVAEELDVDLIVIGSHGRHGIMSLFGSTTSSVLRGSTRDLLCVRIGETAR
jgi:universal stress protein A